MAATIKFDPLLTTLKYNNKPLTAVQQTALQAAIESFLKDKEADLAKEPDKEKPFTLPNFDMTPDTKVVVDFSVTKYVKDGETTVKIKELDAPQKSLALPPINVLAGAEEFLNDATPQTHVGIAITLQSDGDKLSVLTIPDVGKVKDGGSPVFLTKPVVLN